MISVDTKAYGPVDLDERQKINFPSGIFGFDTLREFVLLDARQRPFYWLQSLEIREVAFVLLDPKIIYPDYDGNIDPDDYESLDISGPDDSRLLQFAIVTIPEERQEMTANLQGPLLINRETRVGRQCITRDERWKVRHNVLEEMAKARNDVC